MSNFKIEDYTQIKYFPNGDEKNPFLRYKIQFCIQQTICDLSFEKNIDLKSYFVKNVKNIIYYEHNTIINELSNLFNEYIYHIDNGPPYYSSMYETHNKELNKIKNKFYGIITKHKGM